MLASALSGATIRSELHLSEIAHMRSFIAFLTVITALTAVPASASQCFQLAQGQGARIWNVSLGPGDVKIHFVGHSAFRIETDQGHAAVTDFFGAYGSGKLPDAVTMNNAHSSHWTNLIPDGIEHALEGWGDGINPNLHEVLIGDMLIRNVPTDTRSWSGNRVTKYGNSIFIFEYEGLCIGHLGHLHHKPTEAHYAMIGRLDIVLAPVDGGYTMSIEDIMEVMRRVRARLIIPMHIFSPGSLQRFLTGMSSEYEIEITDEDHFIVNAAMLPTTPTIRVLTPAARDSFLGWEE